MGRHPCVISGPNSNVYTYRCLIAWVLTRLCKYSGDAFWPGSRIEDWILGPKTKRARPSHTLGQSHLAHEHLLPVPNSVTLSNTSVISVFGSFAWVRTDTTLDPIQMAEKGLLHEWEGISNGAFFILRATEKRTHTMTYPWFVKITALY